MCLLCGPSKALSHNTLNWLDNDTVANNCYTIMSNNYCAGEEVLPSVLSLWGKATTGLREQMVEFLRCQVAIHHPLGRHSDDTGAWSYKDKAFKKNMERLYDNLIDDFESSSSRLRWTG